jgi:multiple sugar transport system ATP-binding protein
VSELAVSELALSGVRKVFPAKGRPDVVAVRDLSLGVRRGELVGLLGPSGCGKSTTLRMIAGLEHPTSGDIRLAGRSITGLPPQRRNIGVAFENYALYPPLTVAENLGFGLRARSGRRRGGGREVAARVRQVAERIGLTDILDAMPSGLSSGQKQRVALARAVVREPDVLLLDEPLSHLDAAERDATRRELRRLQQELGHTTILVTHDQEEALSLADRVAVMDDGAVCQVGTPDQVYDDPADLFVARFVGEPAMNLLPGDLESGAVRLAPQAAVPVVVARRRGRVVLGIRPEDVTIAGPEPADVTGVLVVYEDLLEHGLATVEVPGVDTRVVAQTAPGLALSPGDPTPLRLHRKRSFVFDAATGERIR